MVAARVLAGLTQHQLAREARVNVSTLKRLESGQTTPNVRTLAKLERALTEQGVRFKLDPGAEFQWIGLRLERQDTTRNT
jgi:transcriptional regulator with XRE-family HTH domain